MKFLTSLNPSFEDIWKKLAFNFSMSVSDENLVLNYLIFF